MIGRMVAGVSGRGTVKECDADAVGAGLGGTSRASRLNVGNDRGDDRFTVPDDGRDSRGDQRLPR